MTKAYLFLDVDGVLNSTATMVAYESADVLDSVAVALLDRLFVRLREEGLDPEAVISSSWRKLPGFRDAYCWEDFFSLAYDAPNIKVAGVTPSIDDEDPNIDRRGREIHAWLLGNAKPGDKYVIFDDGLDFLAGQPLIKVNLRNGLQLEHVEQAFTMLTGKPFLNRKAAA